MMVARFFFDLERGLGSCWGVVREKKCFAEPTRGRLIQAECRTKVAVAGGVVAGAHQSVVEGRRCRGLGRKRSTGATGGCGEGGAGHWAVECRDRMRRRAFRILLNVATVVSIVIFAWSVWARVRYRDSKVLMAGSAGRGVLIDLDGNGNGNRIDVLVMRELPFGGPDETVIKRVELPGILYRHAILGYRRSSSDNHFVGVSYWWFWVGSALLPLAVVPGWYRRWCRRRRSENRGVCPSCGYDLRATPQRCPECGRAVGGTRIARAAGALPSVEPVTWAVDPCSAHAPRRDGSANSL